MNAVAKTAAQASLIRCHKCELVSPISATAQEGQGQRCPRCGTRLSQRKPQSVQRTWALVASAALLYIPANLLPMMTVSMMHSDESDTIMSGIIVLFNAGWYPVAILIFFASILVPMFKLLGLTGLLIAVHLKSAWRPRDRTVLYRIIEYIGRWSMLDIFTTSLLVALVQLGDVASIEAGPAATCFGGVVILTIFAAMSFDPRLIWDSMEDET
jgi:paraquat-inducible protein A